MYRLIRALYTANPREFVNAGLMQWWGLEPTVTNRLGQNVCFSRMRTPGLIPFLSAQEARIFLIVLHTNWTFFSVMAPENGKARQQSPANSVRGKSPRLYPNL